MEETNWDKINADKRRDILWCAAWNQTAQYFTGHPDASRETIKEMARFLFDEMYAVYKKKKVLPKGIVNLDNEIELPQTND